MKVECGLFDRWASLYRDYRLPGRARTAVERHLGFCHNCAARYEAYSVALSAARTTPPPSSLIPADVTHEIPPPPLPEQQGRLKRAGGRMVLWLLGVILLAGLLTAAFVLGYQTAIKRVNQTPTPADSPPATHRAL